MLRIMNKLKSNIPIALFLSLLIFDNIYIIISSYIINIFDSSITESANLNTSILGIFIISVIIAPLLETFIFQFLVIELLHTFKLDNTTIIFISAALFALSHYYNLIYILIIFLPGLIYATYYLYLKHNNKNGFLPVFFLHSLSNLIPFIFFDLLNWF